MLLHTLTSRGRSLIQLGNKVVFVVVPFSHFIESKSPEKTQLSNVVQLLLKCLHRTKRLNLIKNLILLLKYLHKRKSPAVFEAFEMNWSFLETYSQEKILFLLVAAQEGVGDKI